MKVVINACFGGFGLSPEATLKLWELGADGLDVTHVDQYWPPEKREEDERKWSTLGYNNAITKWREYLKNGKENKRDTLFLTVFTPDEQYVVCARDVKRHDTNLLRVVEEMGEQADGACAALKIVEIPDGVDYEISAYDGNEHVAEKHRTWA